MNTLSIFALLAIAFTAPTLANPGEAIPDQVRKAGKRPTKEMHDAMKQACVGKTAGDTCTVNTPKRGNIEAKCGEAKGPGAGTLICELPPPANKIPPPSP